MTGPAQRVRFRMTKTKAIMIGGSAMVMFLIAALVNAVNGPVPPKDKLREVTAVVEDIQQKTTGKGSSRRPMDAFTLVAKQPNGHLDVLGIGGEKLVSSQDRAFLKGKEVHLLADANRTFEIKVGNRTILPYELALAHWQEDRRDQNEFLLFCFSIWMAVWAVVAIWYWSEYRKYRSADLPRSGALHHLVDSWRAYPYKRQIWHIVAYIVVAFSFGGFLGFLAGIFDGKRCPEHLFAPIIGALYMWLAFSLLLLLRNAPLEHPLPRLLGKAWGPVDWAFILAIVACLGVLIAGRHECI